MLDTHTQLSYMQLVHVMVCSYMMPRAYEPLKEHETQLYDYPNYVHHDIRNLNRRHSCAYVSDKASIKLQF